jgi:integrase
MASVEKRPDGRWRARWREYAGGPQHSRHFPKKVEAERFLDVVRGDLARGVYVDPNAGRRIAFGVYATEWASAQPWRQSTRDRVASVLRVHLAPTFGARPIGSIRSSEVQAWATGLADRLAPSTVEAAYRLLSTIMRAAVADRVLGRSPAEGVRLARRDGVLLVPLTVEEVRTVAAAMPEDLEAAVVVAASTGLRQGELFGLTDDRVGWLRRELVVDRQLVTPSSGPAVLGPCKTARSVRTVPVPDHVLEALAHHRERFGIGEGGFVFHRAGGPWRRARAAEAFAAATKRCGVDASGWHALRHHAASVLIAQGLGVTAVAATLGHSPAECLKTYAGWWPNEHETIRSAMARAWAPTIRGEASDAAR